MFVNFLFIPVNFLVNVVIGMLVSYPVATLLSLPIPFLFYIVCITVVACWLQIKYFTFLINFLCYISNLISPKIFTFLRER